MAKKVDEPVESGQPVAKIVVDEKEHLVSDLDDQGKYLASQAANMDQQITQLRKQMDVLILAKEGFARLLRENINGENKPEIKQ